MKKEKYEEVIENLKLEKNKWITFTEVDSIILNDGRGIYPLWENMRFMLKENEILIQHGTSEPYGGLLGTRYSPSYDFLSISFPAESLLSNSKLNKFRKPKVGDVLRTTIGTEKVISETIITKATPAMNIFNIHLASPIKITSSCRISFYDPTLYNKDTCIHGTESEGIYMKFKPNEGKSKKEGIYHETIKIKSIKEINLKLLKHNNTYKIT